VASWWKPSVSDPTWRIHSTDPVVADKEPGGVLGHRLRCQVGLLVRATVQGAERCPVEGAGPRRHVVQVDRPPG